jgi:hypothetical protein
LRREDYWTSRFLVRNAAICTEQFETPFGRAPTHLEQDSTRAGGNVQANLLRSCHRTRESRQITCIFISSRSPFIVKAIEDLTLKDLTETFRYAVESSKEEALTRTFS